MVNTLSSTVLDSVSLETFRISSLKFHPEEHLILSVRIWNQHGIPIETSAMIDSGATFNFIHTNVVSSNELPTIKKPSP